MNEGERAGLQQLVMGARYWLRPPSKEERVRFSTLASPWDPCAFCGVSGKPTKAKIPMMVKIVPINNPVTDCCGMPEEPPVGSFAMRMLSGPSWARGREMWVYPWYAELLSPIEETVNQNG